MSTREEGRFLRGETGVDGEDVAQEERDVAEIEQDTAVQQLLRGRTYLGREFLTWLLWRSNAGGPITDVDDEPVTVLLFGRLTLRGLGGDATELIVKGAMSPYSEVVRAALDRGLLVHEARLRIQHGERTFEVTVDAERLDVRAADIPKVLSEETDDRLAERLYLAEQLANIVEALFGAFLEVRSSRRWKARARAMKAWFSEAD